MLSRASIAAVVVSFNRLECLKKCIEALLLQSRPLAVILVIDNGSTDGSVEWLQQRPELQVKTVLLCTNQGGAGGFAVGLSEAIAIGVDWAWLMDDDAAPHVNALEELMRRADDPANIYGSLAVSGTFTSWITGLIEPVCGKATNAHEVPSFARVESLPFLGFLVHRNLVAKIGLPDAGFFIAADDTEYCLRAERAGAKIFVAGQSRIEHPASRPYQFSLLGKSVICLVLPPWKRYYDTRNRLLIARRYYGLRLFTHALAGTALRLCVTLIREPQRLHQSYSYFAGALDGLLGLKGRRHEWWGIKR